MALLRTKPNPADTMTELLDREAQAAAAVAKEERESARLYRLLHPGIQIATDPWPPTLTRGQIAVTELALRECSDRLGEAETALEKIRREVAAARLAEAARIQATHRPRKQALTDEVLALEHELQRKCRELIAEEDAEAAELGLRRPSECGRSLAVPGGWGHPEGEERLAERKQVTQRLLEG